MNINCISLKFHLKIYVSNLNKLTYKVFLSIIIHNIHNNKFKVGDFDISDESCFVKPSLVDNAQVMEIIEQNPFSKTADIAEILNSRHQTISDHIRKLVLVYKYSKWGPHCLTEKQLNDRIVIC